MPDSPPTEREHIIAAVTHDAWLIARAGATDSYEWRSAVARIAQAWTQLNERQASDDGR